MKKTIVENFTFNVTNAIVTFIAGVAISIVIARLLGPAGYGSYTLIIWLLGFISLFALMGFSNTVEKYISEYDGRRDMDTVNRIISFVLKIEILWGMIISALLITLAPRLSLWLKHPEFKYLFWIAALLIIPSAINSIFVSANRGLQIFKNILIVNIITLPLSLGATLLVLKRGGGVAGILLVQLGVVLVNITIFSLLLRNVLTLNSGGLDKPLKKRILSFNLSILAIMLLDSIVWRKSEVFFLTMFRTPQEVGYYGLAFGVAAMSVRFIPEAFGGVIGPVLSNRYGAQDRAGLNELFTKSAKYLMLMTVPICIGLAVIARPLIEFVYGKGYLPAAGILPVLVIASGVGVIGYAPAGVIYGVEKQNISLKVLFFVTVVNLVLDILLIPGYGIYGAAIANSIAQVLDIFLLFLWIHVRMKFRFPLVSFAKTFLGGAIAAGVMYFSMAMCEKTLLNLILLLILGEGIYALIIYLTQKEEIKELVNYFYKFFEKRRSKV